MKLLLDQNLSPRLPMQLVDVFPGSAHVDPLGLGVADDDAVWNHARQHGLAIVTKARRRAAPAQLRLPTPVSGSGCPPYGYGCQT